MNELLPFAEQGLGVLAFVAFVYLVFNIGNRLATSVERLSERLATLINELGDNQKTLESLLETNRENALHLRNIQSALHSSGVVRRET